jgi:hypothetical protein
MALKCCRGQTIQPTPCSTALLHMLRVGQVIKICHMRFKVLMKVTTQIMNLIWDIKLMKIVKSILTILDQITSAVCRNIM